jgi:Mn-dependent DtxR family transcriptional regulator
MLLFPYNLLNTLFLPGAKILHIRGNIMKIQKSAEDYLESILVVQQRKNHVRAIDIANELDFAKPSVSVALKNLEQGGYISRDSEGFITLTPAGSEIAEKIYERHRVLSGFLMKLGVEESIALEDACKMEHCISATSFDKLKAFLEESELS